MSRVIKFRAWDKGFNRMLMGVGVHPHICCIHDNYRKGEIGSYTISPEFVSYELMQFTGITDRNGVEIYESDVVRWLVNTDHSVDAPVGFESGAFYMLDAINQGYGKVYNDWLRGEYTVLGNIYEHPELLEAKP